MGIQNIEIRGCKSKRELFQVIDLCDSSFPETAKEYFERHALKDETLSLDDTRILLLDGGIVSSVQVFPRTIYIKSSKLKVGGIGNVATLPLERKHGYAALLIKDAIKYIKQMNYPVSILTTVVNSYYERFGFQTINRSIVDIEVTYKNENPNVRKFDIERDLSRVMKLYHEYNHLSLGPVVRDEDYWKSQFNFCGEDKDLFLIYEETGILKGFIRGKRGIDRIKIWEYAGHDMLEDVVSELFKHVSSMTKQNRIEMFLSEDERERIDQHNIISKKKDTDLMIKFLDENINDELKCELLQDNRMTFWLTDFF
jgi:predicted N-acetyltransferase YhbS